MIRVVLIDDEAIILEGLKKVVDWSGFGCEVVATAQNAAAGAAAIRRCQPHIVITDIKMPDQDGLTMLAGLKSEFPALEITVLTGYRDFDYAQEAIRLGVTRLLLKPSKMDEINEAMRVMTENLRASGAAQEDAEEDDKPAGSFLVRKALQFMEAHYAEKLTLQDVADHCYVSQWHLSKLLNRHAQKSFYDLLNETRIKQAQRLLSDPKLKIGDIGERVGYCDPGHFARTFKKLTGMSAYEYRNGKR
ncbi:MAG: response regulator [Clostridiales bacterium]|nr:response regulator [Clostridiales bacterium]